MAVGGGCAAIWWSSTSARRAEAAGSVPHGYALHNASAERRLAALSLAETMGLRFRVRGPSGGGMLIIGATKNLRP